MTPVMDYLNHKGFDFQQYNQMVFQVGLTNEMKSESPILLRTGLSI